MRILLSVGGLVIALAVAWLWITYRDVIQYDFISTREEAICFLGDSSIRQQARALCRQSHPFGLIGYWSASLWIGAILLSSGALLRAMPSFRETASARSACAVMSRELWTLSPTTMPTRIVMVQPRYLATLIMSLCSQG